MWTKLHDPSRCICNLYGLIQSILMDWSEIYLDIFIPQFALKKYLPVAFKESMSSLNQFSPLFSGKWYTRTICLIHSSKQIASICLQYPKKKEF